ncbi:uncharacterized protein LOC132557080 [Ylistrum balloti]|uniref:uncharacterized protein LOC132557080 n=1 Tax=Ylistrum balloti TaxID=509963 RepID=UPI0029059CFE|nr:uncharacterized protein LOC132557080 [Ylistrum balloti]
MESNLINERITLITKLKDVLGKTEDGRHPLNIVFIGMPGCGKSSFINSIAASIADDYWREYAISGQEGSGTGTSRQTTIRIKSFKAADYVTSKRLQGYACPTLTDISGFGDEDSEITEEILRLIFYGQLRDNENLHSVFRFGKENGVTGLRSKYGKVYTEASNKVDRIIVVASATQPIPRNLIQSVMKAARSQGDQYKREVPVFGNLTKFDEVDESSTEFKDIKQGFIESLSLVGASHRFAQCANYCDEIDPLSTRTNQTLPDIDVPILRFMNVVCGRNYQVANPNEDYWMINFFSGERSQQLVNVFFCIIITLFSSMIVLSLGLFTKYKNNCDRNVEVRKMEDANLQERTQLIDDLKFKVGRCNRRPLNIVFIGTPGCGKSSFINSFAAAIADKCWQEFAFSGGGGRLLGDNQTTVRMQCIASENYVTSSNLKDWSLPTLIDLTGFQDEDEEITSDLLRLIFYGKLKNSTNIHKVFRFGRRFGVEALRWRYGVFSTECHFKVDRVVFIASATREIPVFGVLTEYDLVVESQTEEYKERKRRFQELLALGGASHRFLECANYCDDVDPAMTRTRQILPQIDIPILKFMNVASVRAELCRRKFGGKLP